MSVWCHPVDAHYEFTGIQGWPKISFEVWEMDPLGKAFLGGYGFVVLPMSPGKHDIQVTLWKPVGTSVEAWTARYCGGAPHLRSQELVHTPTSRYQLTSESAGTVHLTISVILGRMSSLQVEF
jgi:B9 domain-containing protein 2